VLLAVRPVGCVGEACFELGRRHRESEDLAWVLLISVLLLAVSAGIAVHQREGGRTAWRRTAFALLLLGAVLLVLGLFMNASFAAGSPLWLLHDSDTLGRMLPVVGTLAAGVGLAASPGARWLAPVLIGTALIGLGFNAQDERTLLSIPVGLAWIAYGGRQVSRAARPAERLRSAPTSGERF
jgi:energy-coupling factor transporter transmembrane protein EcfT